MAEPDGEIMMWIKKMACLCLAAAFLAAGCGDPYQKGLDFLARGEFEKAAQFFLQQTRLHPDDPRAYNELGFAYVRLKMYDQAGPAYATAIKLKPDYVDAYLNLGTMFLYKLDPDNAALNLNKAIQLDPNCEACRVNLAWTYINMNRFDQAKEQIDKAAEIAGSENKYANIVAEIQRGKERFDMIRERSKEELEKKKAEQPAGEPPALKPGGTE